MNKNLKILSKHIKFSILWFAILIVIGIIININTNNSLQDILFFEGIFTVIIGLLGSFEGSPSAFPIQPLNDVTNQCMANVNLEILKKERHSIKTEINPLISTFTIVLAGIIPIIISSFL